MAEDSRILWFNHRDITHPQAGGAELYIQETGKRLVAMGHDVTLFCERYAKATLEERIDGILIRRRGGPYGVHLMALLADTSGFDVVVDDMAHGIPFYPLLLARGVPVCAMLMHWHDKVFFTELGFPKNLIAKIGESTIPLLYRRNHWIVISHAGRRELLRRGFEPSRITVIPPGVDVDSFRPSEKSDSPLIVCISRLKKYKNIDHLILAHRKVVEKHPNSKLVIVGTGDHAAKLKEQVRRLRLSDRVTLDELVCLRGDQALAKIKLLQKAWMLVVPSSFEGFSLVAIEAMACGTPVVTTDIPSLKDLVQRSGAGITFPSGDATALANSICALIEDDHRRSEMGAKGRSYAMAFSWDTAARRLEEILSAVSGRFEDLKAE